MNHSHSNRSRVNHCPHCGNELAREHATCEEETGQQCPQHTEALIHREA